jgi:hypothetical protein
VYTHFEELKTTEYKKKSGKGTGLTTAFKCNKCSETVQQTESVTSNLDRAPGAWNREVTMSSVNSHTAEIVDSDGAVKVGHTIRCSCILCSLFIAFVVHALTPALSHSCLC